FHDRQTLSSSGEGRGREKPQTEKVVSIFAGATPRRLRTFPHRTRSRHAQPRFGVRERSLAIRRIEVVRSFVCRSVQTSCLIYGRSGQRSDAATSKRLLRAPATGEA